MPLLTLHLDFVDCDYLFKLCNMVNIWKRLMEMGNERGVFLSQSLCFHVRVGALVYVSSVIHVTMVGLQCMVAGVYYRSLFYRHLNIREQ